MNKLLNKIKDKDWAKILDNLHWLSQYIRKYWYPIGVYTVLGIFGSAFGLVSSIVSKNLIDAVTGFNTRSIGWAIGLYVGLGVGRVFINVFTGKISLLIQSRVSNEIQKDIYDQVMVSEWESLSEYTTGDLLMRTTNDTAVISNNVLSLVPTFITTSCNFIGALLIVLYYDPIMALIALIGAPITFLTSRYRMSSMQSFQRESQKMASKRMMFNQETFTNIQSIKAFDLIDDFSLRLKDLQEESLSLSLRQYKYQAWTNIIMSLTGLVVSYACYGFAIFRLWQGDISFGTMTLFVSMASNLSGSFSSVVHLVPTAIRASISVERVRHLIDLPKESYTDLKKANRIRTIGQNAGVYVSMDSVSFHYKDGRPVYDDANLLARPGEIIALIGPSGQGKTTTLRLLLGLIAPQVGSIWVGNPSGEKLVVSPSTRCLFSYVPQEKTMFYGTIAENLRMVKPMATDAELEDVLRTAHAWQFVSELEQGMYTMIGERGLGLSEGQNQRLSIARALLDDSPILLLDEATSALDVATERKVLRSILKKDPHRTVIVTAHRPSVFSMCNRVYKMEDQKVCEVDDADIQKFLEQY